MKKLIQLNMLMSLIIIGFAVADLLFLFVLDYPASFVTFMLIVGIAGVVIGGLIGLKIKSSDVQFEENFISERLGGISSYFTEFSTAIAGAALIASIYLIGYINILTIGGGLFTILSGISYLKTAK